MRTAVITLAAGRHAHLMLQQDGLARGTRSPDRYVIVAMADPDIARLTADRRPTAEVITLPLAEARLPLAAARNEGAAHALRAGADLLIFLDVDCVPGPALVSRYADAARDGALLCGTVAYLPPPPRGGYRLEDLDGMARPHPARPAPAAGQVLRGGDPHLFWSLSFAVTARTWEHVGGFCEAYTGYGGEDTDFAATAAHRGVDLWWVGGAPAYHQHHPTQEPPVQHLDDILRNAATYKQRWGTWPMEGWLRAFEARGLAVYDRDADTWHRSNADHGDGHDGDVPTERRPVPDRHP
ncbi:galactosyltransferase-related protein [Streptomyces kunmingensis]|uniref:Galactosyltransferase-related protein n=1 Tax=Streptomyces kunmingensis TaxID=68225 RepID=A0ABU6C377_9ACTN|nr:galactosyltransferase-related protein [Streptomyces kunmingensis]MEB3958785.1 galactosyltransferase-related protein [Streptomyces kunmingensis]